MLPIVLFTLVKYLLFLCGIIVVGIVSVLVLIRYLQYPGYKYLAEFPGRYETIPLVSNLSLLFSLKRTEKHVSNYSTLLFNYMLGQVQIHRKNHGLHRFYIGPQGLISIYRADHLETVLTHSTNVNKGFAYFFLQSWLGDGLLLNSGAKWKARRKLLTPGFHFRILEDFVGPINTHAAVLIKRLSERKDQTDDIIEYISPCALDIVCETVMGTPVNCQTSQYGQQYLSAVKSIGAIFTERMQSVLLFNDFIFSLTPMGKKYKKLLAIVHDFSLKVINERRQELLANPKELDRLEGSGEEGAFRSKIPFMDLMLLHHLRHKTISVEGIQSEVNTFMFGGHDTTSHGTAFAIFLLGHHPEVQKKLRMEIDDVVGDSVVVTVEHIKEMRYLEMALKETQRVLPSVPIIARKLDEEIFLDGKRVPAGTNIHCQIYCVHHDPRYYPDPEVFDPERFSPENSVGRNPFVFIPFSAGPRNCIGQRFAMLEEKIILTTLLQKYELRSLDHLDTIDLAAELVLRPVTPLRVALIPRSK